MADTNILTWDQIAPVPDVVGCWQFEKDMHFTYRVPSHHLLLVESGHIAGITPQGHFDAPPGTMLCFRPAEKNEYRAAAHTIYYQGHVSFAPFPHHRHTPFFPGLGILPVRIQLDDAFDEMRGLFETLLLMVPGKDAASHFRAQAAVYNMLALIASAMKPADDESIRLDAWERVRLRLHSISGFSAKINDLAGEMGISGQHFNRVFRRRFGCGPKEYQTRARLNEAIRRIRGTELSIKTIAGDLGFDNPRSMSRLIHRKFSVLPLELRQTMPEASSAFEDKNTPKRPYPMNQHLVPPEAPADWAKQYLIARPNPS